MDVFETANKFLTWLSKGRMFQYWCFHTSRKLRGPCFRFNFSSLTLLSMEMNTKTFLCVHMPSVINTKKLIIMASKIQEDNKIKQSFCFLTLPPQNSMFYIQISLFFVGMKKESRNMYILSILNSICGLHVFVWFIYHNILSAPASFGQFSKRKMALAEIDRKTDNKQLSFW